MAATGAIWLRFVGPTRSSEVPDFIAALTEMMPAEDANVVFDLRQLVGHNPDTKEPIKAWLVANKPRIAQITVLVPESGAILKMVTAVIASIWCNAQSASNAGCSLFLFSASFKSGTLAESRFSPSTRTACAESPD